MGIISYIINRILGSVHVPQYDDSAIIDTAQNIPNIISETSRTQIKAIIDEIHQVYTAANSKEFTIGLIGDFTVGKSSFVNAAENGAYPPNQNGLIHPQLSLKWA